MGVAIGFLAGFITAISPCVLPVLPILLAGGATAARRPVRASSRASSTSFVVFTLFAPGCSTSSGCRTTCCGTSRSRCSSWSRRRCSSRRSGALIERPLRAAHRGDRARGGGFLLGARSASSSCPAAGRCSRRIAAVGQRRTSASAPIALTLAYALGAARRRCFAIAYRRPAHRRSRCAHPHGPRGSASRSGS